MWIQKIEHIDQTNLYEACEEITIGFSTEEKKNSDKVSKEKLALMVRRALKAIDE